MRRLVALLALALAGCQTKSQPAAGASGSGSGSAASGSGSAAVPSTRLFGEDEIAALLADLDARLAANKTRACPGPKVVAKATPGPSWAVIGPTLEGTGAMKECGDQLAKITDMPAAVTGKTADLVAADTACGQRYAEAFALAAAHVEGCSPYVAGVLANPDLPGPQLRVMNFVAFHAGQLAAAGKVADAVTLLVDALRVAQDLGRGRVTMIMEMISIASLDIITKQLDEVVGKLDRAQLDALAGQLDTLLAATPSFGEALAGERDTMDIYFGATHLRDASWNPPGGWDAALRHVGDSPLDGVADPRDTAGMMMATSRQNAPQFAAACPPSASITACSNALAALAATAKPATDANVADMTAEMTKPNVDVAAVRAKIRATLLQVLSSTLVPAFAQYPSRQASQVSHLAEVRLHVEVLRAGACPTAPQLAQPPYAAITAPAALGDQLDLSVAGKTITAHPPAWTKPPATWSFTCPR